MQRCKLAAHSFTAGISHIYVSLLLPVLSDGTKARTTVSAALTSLSGAADFTGGDAAADTGGSRQAD